MHLALSRVRAPEGGARHVRAEILDHPGKRHQPNGDGIHHWELNFNACTTHPIEKSSLYFMMHSPAVHSIVASIQASVLLCLSLPVLGQIESARFSSTGESSTKAPAIVIGFVGGFVSHDDSVHSGVQLAARLRNDYPSGIHIEVFENRYREAAHEEITKLLDTNHDGTLSFEEKRDARIIIYGMSWGGSEAVTLARQLGKDGIPVLLTIQVDSITKIGENDELIPANVSYAANFYQPNGALHGRPKIRAADEARTRIIGNFRFDYELKPVRCDKYPWYDRVFAKTHTEIECDPVVWNQVETLIRSKLPPMKPSRSPGGPIQ